MSHYLYSKLILPFETVKKGKKSVVCSFMILLFFISYHLNTYKKTNKDNKITARLNE